MIRDRNIDHKTGRLFLPASRWTGDAFDAGAVAIIQISNFLYGAPEMYAAGDLVSHYMMVPNDWDPEFELGFKVWWGSASATTTDKTDWIVLLDFFAEGATMTAAATALSTAVALDDLSTGAYDFQKSARGIRDAGWRTRAQVDAGALMVFSVEADATDIAVGGGAEALTLLGIEIDYTVRMTNS